MSQTYRQRAVFDHLGQTRVVAVHALLQIKMVNMLSALKRTRLQRKKQKRRRQNVSAGLPRERVVQSSF